MVSEMAVATPLKWHGGKSPLANRIAAMMPPHTHYCEAFAGGLSVLLAKSPIGVSEVVNDVHRDLTNFWRVLQDPDQFARFQRVVQAVPFSEVEWRRAVARLKRGPGDDAVDDAVAFFICCRQSLAGRMDSFSPLSRSRVRCGQNEQASGWLSAVVGLPAVHARLSRVAVLCRPAAGGDSPTGWPQTLFYLDPPYLHETRTAKTVYTHEMSENDHRELLGLVRMVRGKVLLSGYPSAMYDTALADWNRHTFDCANHAANGELKRRQTEVIWTNF